MVQSVFNEHQCKFINFHPFSVDHSMKVIVTWWFFVPAWVTFKLWKGVFSDNFGMEAIMVQSVLISTNACSSTFIFLVLISVFPWFSMKVIVTWWFFVPVWVTLTLWKEVFSYNFGMEKLMVQSVFNEHQCTFINSHFFSVVQHVSLVFHERYSYLMIFCASMSDIKTMKRSVFMQFWYGEFNGALCF